MQTYGASVTPSPSDTTEVGRKILGEHPGHHRQPGLRHLRGRGSGHHPATDYRYVLGSVLNQVLLHQSVIGLETKTAMDKYGVIARISSSAAPAAAPTWAA